MMAHYPCVVVADGLFPTCESVLEQLRRAHTVIACDGAAQTLIEYGITPTAIVGDMDSLSPALREKLANRICVVDEQETNDLTKAMHYAWRKGYQEVLILGATGKREDHTLGNISLLLDYVTLFERVEMASDYGLFTPLIASAQLSSRRGQQVSFFSLQSGCEVTTHNLRYPLVRRDLTSWWQGTLNEALDDSFRLELSPDTRLVVFREW